MDSLTQFVLGAAVGEATAGHRVGRRALLWGGVVGTLPDLDVIFAPWQTAAEALHFHRGPTHSLLFAFVAAPLLGWLISRLYHKRRPDLADAKTWMWLAFWALWTHPMLDFFTVYGTQVLWPLTDKPFELGSVFIIDPLYTVPLLVAVGVAAFQRRTEKRFRAVQIGLSLATLYLAAGLGVKAHVSRVIFDGLARQGVVPERLTTMTSPFNTLLWYGVAEVDSGFVATTYSLFDSDRRLSTQFVPRRADLLAPLAGDPAVETLRWFSEGYWSMAQKPDGLYLRDLRFGRADGWLTDQDDGYIFTFRLIPLPGGGWTFEHVRPEIAVGPALQRLHRRVRGEEP